MNKAVYPSLQRNETFDFLIQLLAFVDVYIQYKNPLFKIERDK